MERAQSARKSSARNAFGKELTKNRIKCNVELGGGIERGIDANDQVFVVPWKVTGGGALACFKHDQVGKLSEQPSLLQAHKSPLTSFSLCDIDSSLLATSARDATVKVSCVPPLDIVVPIGSCLERVVCVCDCAFLTRSSSSVVLCGVCGETFSRKPTVSCGASQTCSKD